MVEVFRVDRKTRFAVGTPQCHRLLLKDINAAFDLMRDGKSIRSVVVY
jgi:Zn-dependent alcohol dehydrogenase